MNGFVDPIHKGLAVGHSAQARARQEAEAPRDDRGLVGDDVAEEVAGHDDAVQAPRVLHHDHGGRVDKLVLELELGELGRHNLIHDLLPQPAGGQHVGLVQRPDLGGRGALQGEVGGQARDALDLGPRVGLRVPGRAVAVVLLARAEVDAARQLAHDGEVDALADRSLEGGPCDEGRGGEVAGPQVAEGAEGGAQAEEPLLRADFAGAPFLEGKR